MKARPIILLISISCLVLLMLSAGCGGDSRIRTQNKLLAMSDSELIKHYEMIELRMIDIDRKIENAHEQDQQYYDNDDSETGFNRLRHLHIGDTWSQLRKERALTRTEMKNRGISPPKN